MSPVLYLEEPLRSFWAGQDAFAAVSVLQGEVLRALEGRRTLRTEIGGHGYYAKIHGGIGWREILKNLLAGRLPVLGAGNEWRALRRLTTLGVDTLRPVAFGVRGDNPARQHSFIVTEEIAPAISLEDFCRHWPTQPPALRLKHALIEQLATLARRMHRGGVNHRDFYLCHFLLHLPLNTPTPRLSLIDLHRAQVRKQVPQRWRDKDLAALYFSALDIGLTRRDRLRFLRTYFDRPLRTLLTEESALLARLESRSAYLMERYRRKYAPEPTP